MSPTTARPTLWPRRARLRSAQVVHLREADDGERTCAYCDRPARWLGASGPDPALTPECDFHAAELLTIAATMIRRRSGLDVT